VITLVVEGTWDGRPVAPHARVELACVGDALEVRIDAIMVGDPPPPGPPRALPGLWDHEVVEVFIAGPPHDRTAPYVELEVGPHGHWLAWSFVGYRERAGDVALAEPPAVARAGDRWRATLCVPLAALPPAPWRVNAFALHGAHPDARRYLAATPLGGERPDFHRVEDYPITACTRAGRPPS